MYCVELVPSSLPTIFKMTETLNSECNQDVIREETTSLLIIRMNLSSKSLLTTLSSDFYPNGCFDFACFNAC